MFINIKNNLEDDILKFDEDVRINELNSKIQKTIEKYHNDLLKELEAVDAHFSKMKD